MANDLETLRQRLRDVLYDVEDSTWPAGEKDDILQMAVRRLARRVPRPLDPTAYEITLVTATYFYAIDPAIIRVERVFYTNSDSDRIGFLESGWEVVGEATNGQEAIERYQELHPDAVTLDLVMPEHDGMHALHGIMELDPEAKVLVVSALEQRGVLKDAIKAGASDFISKPFELQGLQATLDQLYPDGTV